MSHLLSVIVPYTAGVSVHLPETTTGDLSLALGPLPPDIPVPISYALEYLADALLEQGEASEAAAVFDELGQKCDRMRAGYWEYRKRQCMASC